MKITINGGNLDFTLENEKTVGDVLKAIDAKLRASFDATLLEVRINGKEIGENGAGLQPLDSVQTLDIRTISSSDVVSLFQSAKSIFDSLEKNLASVPVLVQSGKSGEISQKITQICTDLDTVFGLFRMQALFPAHFKNLRIEGNPVSVWISEIAEKLHEFSDAFATGDFVLVGDLAEYEILPRIKAASRISF